MKLRSGYRTPEPGGGRSQPKRHDMGDTNEEKNDVKFQLEEMNAKQYGYEWPNIFISKLYSLCKTYQSRILKLKEKLGYSR